jgi:soluble cytochrome b562
MRAVAALLLALLVTLGGIGCGGGSSDRLSKSEYESKVKSIGGELKSNFGNFDPSKGSGSLEAQIGQAQTKLNSAASELRKLKPPKDAEADTTKLADGLSGLARQFNSLKQAVASGNLAQVQKIANEVKTSPSTAAANQAAQDLQKKGYKIGDLGT